MAYLKIDYYSNALRRMTSFEMMIPNENEVVQKPMKTIFLLHGYTGKAGNWIPEELAVKYNLAIVMPTAENSFYLNGISSGHAYQDMVGLELVDYVRKIFHLAEKVEDTYICGMSMGGFGALHTGLAYPERFGKIGALSSALIVHEIAQIKPGMDNGVANYEYYRECFGDLEQVLKSDNNPETLVRKIKAAGNSVPSIYMCCGTEDFLLENNREFHQFLLDQEVPHQYHEGSGGHDMEYWSRKIKEVIIWMFDQDNQ